MIKKFIRRVFRLGPGSGLKVIPRDKHAVSRDGVSPGALKVCEVLKQHGHQAYLVGGAVRDLLLGHRPKDFDVATGADPEVVHRLFRRSRIIGRRFRLVHVMFGNETVEVSTFRAGSTSEVDEHGRVLRDNIYGSREEDAARRDFTINALYYDPLDETILDFHGGLKDLRRKTVRVIGEPRARYREDPVRMLRAARFAAKFGFTIDERSRAPIREMAPLLENVPPSRVFEEMLKLLLSGHAATSVRHLRDEGLHHGLLPLLDVILEQPLGERFVMLALEQTDERVRTDKGVSPAFLFAALLWHEVLAAARTAESKGQKRIPALYTAMDSVLDIQTDKLAIPRRFTAIMKDIWALQPRFEQRSGRRPHALITQERFRAGFDFLVVRAASGEVPEELAQWWQGFLDAGEEERQSMLMPAEPNERRRRRRKRKPRAAPPATAVG
ncbi:MAG: polynucleotide adenylyltransferase PcnB [Betaproteobacteria bacterium]|nr:polynucleotide adenylyltransferase PcnB [Betaproteobacteria bacterium]